MSQPNPNAFYTIATGSSSTRPFIEHFANRDPTPYDINYSIQQRWFNISASTEFILVDFSNDTGSLLANWFPITSSGGGGGDLIWVNATSTPIDMLVNHGYVTSIPSVTYTLPAIAALGDEVQVMNNGGNAIINANGGQTIVFGALSGTSLASTKTSDCITLNCTIAGSLPTFQVRASQGNWTVS